MEQALHPRAERGVMSRSLPYLKELLAALLLSALLPSAAFAADEETDPLESSDVLVRAKAKGMLTACADPYDFPYALQNSDPPGFDVEIMRSVAKRGGMRLDLYWINTASRGGTARAFRNSILSRKCDVFLGLSDNGDDDMLMHRMVFTKPYIGMGYVLVTQGKAQGMKSIEDFKNANMKVAVAMSTPMDDYLFMNKVPREIYMDNRRIMGGLVKGEVDAGLMWSTALGLARMEFPKAQFKMVEGYVPGEGHRFNGVWAIRKEDKNLIKFVNEGIDELLSNGRIKEIVEGYGVPFYSPFP
jgi:ABC-type amino acid transport substrate-binding protein